MYLSCYLLIVRQFTLTDDISALRIICTIIKESSPEVKMNVDSSSTREDQRASENSFVVIS